MIRWCAYCQGFIDEVEPFDDYRISHGVCAACTSRSFDFDQSDRTKLQAIIDFYGGLKERVLAEAPANVTSILAESGRLGIRPLDLMFAMLAPLLAQVGDAWAAGKVTVYSEHRISAVVEALISGIRSETLSANDQPVAPALVLVNAEGNYHTLGLQMAEVYFAACGIPTLTVLPGLPTGEVLDLLDSVRPKAVGFSVALPTQMRQVREVKGRLRELPSPPQRIIVGGPALRLGLHPDASFGFDVCRNLSDVPGVLSAT